MQAIRNFQFSTIGYFNYTHSDELKPALTGSLQNVNYVITGPTSGIGYEAAIFAAHKKAKVFLICRNEQKAERTRKEIIKNTNNEEVHVILGQLGEKKNMAKIVEEIKNRVGRIDILVHNAGFMKHEYQENADRVEQNFATNVLAVYYLTKQLLPCLHEHSKVISVTSSAMYNVPLVTDDLFMKNETFDGYTQYSRNKRMQMCIIEEFAKIYKDKGIFVSMHPGWVDTPGIWKAMPEFYDKLKDKLKTPKQGADTINFLAIQPIKNLKNGELYYDRRVVPKHLPISFTSYSQKDADQLMSKLHQLADV